MRTIISLVGILLRSYWFNMSQQRGSTTAANEGNIVRKGHLKKLKGLSKKFFVLRGETNESSACLEYFDSEKKFLAGQQPKRSIALKTCFNINKRQDVKSKHVIALYTKDDCFCICLPSEEELDSWLKTLLSLQRGEEILDGEVPKPTFEHVWQVTILSRGLGNPDIQGDYSLCFSNKTLTLIKKTPDSTKIHITIPQIRTCGSLKNYLFLEIGRASVLGAGELWLDATDTYIAQNINSTIYHAMYPNKSDKDKSEGHRNRSSSATESSKPTNGARKFLYAGFSKGFFNQDTSQTNDQAHPSSGSSQHPIVSGVASLYQHLIHRAGVSKTSERRHSISGGLGWSGHVNHQRTQSLPITDTPPVPISETSPPPPPTILTKHTNQIASKCMGGGGRERCDSMPSRPRTSSEGNHPISIWNHTKALLGHRPNSVYNHDVTHSPPVGSPAASPPSMADSTDSVVSAYSLGEEQLQDVTDGASEAHPMLGRRTGHGHLTPDEAIAEEDCVDSPCCTYGASPGNSTIAGYMPMAPNSSDDGYVDMSPRDRDRLNTMSPTASSGSVTSTDIKFSEYPLQKVSSYFMPSDDDISSTDRPPRAYSVGSKPETYKYKKNVELSSTPENCRARAFSVGSKSKKVHSRVLSHHNCHCHPGVKSSSAPILSNSRVSNSHGSIGPMDDLMEMDFSKPNEGYVEMTPCSKSNSGYLEMKPGLPETAKNEVNPYVDMGGSSPSKSTFISLQDEANKRLCEPRNDYMEMDVSRRQRTSSLKCSTSPHNSWHQGNLNDIKRHHNNNHRCSHGSPKSDYMDMQPGKESKPQTPEGYVEMNFANSCHPRQSSFDGSLTNSKSCEDYTIMSLGKKDERKEKRSQPIQIQGSASNSSQVHNKNSSPTSPFSNFLGRKYSTGTPPKMHLPLTGTNSPYSSLPRQRSRTNSRHDSKDSSSSSLTTPSSSSTIFPLSLNSPCSPVKPQTKESNIRVPSAVLNTVYKGSSRLDNNNEDYTMMDFEKKTSRENTSDYVNYNPGPCVKTTRNTDDNDYAIMLPSRITKTVTSLPVLSKLASLNLNDSSNHFRPITENRCEENSSSINDRLSNNVEESAYEKLRTNRPSSVNSECVRTFARSVSDGTDKRPSSVSSDLNQSRPSSTSSELNSSSSTLVGSRPDSVNSDRIRPGSVSSESQLHYASLDLPQCDESEGSKSPRTSKSSPNEVQAQTTPKFSYAEIDFIKSEELKQNTVVAGSKVKN